MEINCFSFWSNEYQLYNNMKHVCNMIYWYHVSDTNMLTYNILGIIFGWHAIGRYWVNFLMKVLSQRRCYVSWRFCWWVYGYPWLFLVGLLRIPAYQVDYTSTVLHISVQMHKLSYKHLKWEILLRERTTFLHPTRWPEFTTSAFSTTPVGAALRDRGSSSHTLRQHQDNAHMESQLLLKGSYACCGKSTPRRWMSSMWTESCSLQAAETLGSVYGPLTASKWSLLFLKKHLPQ